MAVYLMGAVGRNPATGKLDGMFSPEEITIIGAIGHGQNLTVNLDRFSEIDFGTRENIKPLLVIKGDSRFGSSLGRLTTEHISPNAVIDSVVKNGALASSWRLDLREFGDSGIIGTPFTSEDQTKPLLMYIERRYGFDFDDPAIQCNGYYFNSPPWENSNVFSIDIDGRTFMHTNDNSPSSVNNSQAVAVIMAAQINADDLCKCTANANDGTFDLRLLKKNVEDEFTPVLNENVTQNFNNKTARVYAWDNSGINDAIMITHGYGNRSITYMENTEGSTSQPDYDAKPELNSWMCEDQAAPELTADARQAYFDLRREMTQCPAQLNLCIKTLQDDRK